MNGSGAIRRRSVIPLLIIAMTATGHVGLRAAQAQQAPEDRKTMPAVAVGADYSEIVARALAAQATGDAVAQGSTVRLGSRALGVLAVVDKVMRHDGKAIVTLEVHCKIDGIPAEALVSGSLGIDEQTDAAAQASVHEWVSEYGIAIVDALRAKSKRDLKAGRFTVFPGMLGIRGDAPDAIKAGSIYELQRRFFQKLGPSLPGLIGPDATRLHSITLMLVVRKGAIEGECRVDGKVSDELFRIARAFDWPAPTTTYMLKQYYVLSLPAHS